MLCEAMKWNHLPEQGGLYDQNPNLIDHFYYIFAEKAKEDAKRQAEQERQSSRGGNRKMGRGGSRR